MRRLIEVVAYSLFLLISLPVFSGDSNCEGYTSEGNPFQCGSHGNCTWWAAYKRPDMWGKFGGNARYWYDNAAGAGFDVGSAPKIDAIAVFAATASNPYGHVAYIERINDDGSFYVSEMDYTGSLGTHDGLQHATYHPYSGNLYTREDAVTGMGSVGGWSLTGFVYRRPFGENSTCSYLNSRYTVCWKPSSTDISCPAGSDWVLYDSYTSSMIRLSTNEYCPNYSADVGGGGISTTSTPPVSGSQPDHTPDFDVLHLDNHEISSNCNGCPTESVTPGQMIKMRLETQTSNRNVQTSDLYNSNSQSIDGEVWCQVEGHTSWEEIPGSEDQLEYDVSNLITVNNSSVETIPYTVPNYPGAILACQAKVDGDNEVREESESNNTSRVERFLIVSGTSQSSSPPSSGWMIPILNLILD